MGFWTDKRVLVSGGSKGIGRSAALQMAEKGARVVILARGQEALDATLAELNAISSGHGAVSADVTDIEAVKGAVQQAVDTLGGLDVVICNAGMAQMTVMHDCDEAHYRKLMEVNCFGMIWLTQAAAPHLWASKGHICFVSSVYGFLSTWAASGYTASKYAIVGFAEAVRQEFLIKGVTTTIFYPGTTETPGLEKENEDKDPIAWKIESENAFNKIYTADETANALLRTVERGNFYGTGLFIPWLFRLAARMVPRVVHMVLDMDLRGALKKMEAEGDARA
jgi:NAD(P)-dependent dehydrogenase (short-subunit alcohol dehydrogenase family)